MLRKGDNGPPFPWTEILSQRDDMIEVFMTQSEILGISNPQQHTTKTIKLHMTKDQKPGPGWFKLKTGTWQRRKKK